MSNLISNQKLTIDLYHGTSTLFLDSIVKYGLGGKNPVSEWNLIQFCNEVYELSEKYLKDTELYEASAVALKNMAEQTSSTRGFNYQHGNTYLTPSENTAVRYATNKDYGSELLSYIFMFLEELLLHNVQQAKEELMSKYYEICKLRANRPAPILITLKNVPVDSLLNENGTKPAEKISLLEQLMDGDNETFELLTQQINFRLVKPVLANQLKIELINLHVRNKFNPVYNLYRIQH